MRSRNIKPGVFKNYALGHLEVMTRWLFAGLWCMADRLGRLEDEPGRIKIEILPYDALEENQVSTMLEQLQKSGFISRYEIKGNRYIQIINFTKHQYPHIREQDSTIPAPCKPRASTIQAHLNPDVLIPDVLNPESITLSAKVSDWFLKTWNAYPKERRHGKDVAFKRYQKAVKTLEDAKAIARALENYLKSKAVAEGFVMRASKWFDEWEDHADDNTRDSQGVHSSNADPRGTGESASSREQAAVAYDVLRATADSKAFGKDSPPNNS